MCGRGVESFGQAAKPDASQPQGLNGLDQLLHRSRQPVEFPHDQRVAAARILKETGAERDLTGDDIEKTKERSLTHFDINAIMAGTVDPKLFTRYGDFCVDLAGDPDKRLHEIAQGHICDKRYICD